MQADFEAGMGRQVRGEHRCAKLRKRGRPPRKFGETPVVCEVGAIHGSSGGRRTNRWTDGL